MYSKIHLLLVICLTMITLYNSYAQTTECNYRIDNISTVCRSNYKDSFPINVSISNQGNYQKSVIYFDDYSYILNLENLNYKTSINYISNQIPIEKIIIKSVPCSNSDVYISELHYDNTGTDTIEMIEVSAPADTDLSNYFLLLYNGSNGKMYKKVYLTKSNPKLNGLSIWTADSKGIQNGPDGIALFDNSSQLIEAISYEGSFIGTNDLALGVQFQELPIIENSQTAKGKSLQRNDFGWILEDNSFGDVNHNSHCKTDQQCAYDTIWKVPYEFVPDLSLINDLWLCNKSAGEILPNDLIYPFESVASFNDETVLSNIVPNYPITAKISSSEVQGEVLYYKNRDNDFAIYNNQWSENSNIDLTKYFQYSISTIPGFVIDFHELNFKFSASASGPNTLVLVSSTDSFKTSKQIASINIPKDTIYNEVIWTPIKQVLSDKTNRLDIRIYGYGATTHQGVMRIDDVRVLGEAIDTTKDLEYLFYLDEPTFQNINPDYIGEKFNININSNETDTIWVKAKLDNCLTDPEKIIVGQSSFRQLVCPQLLNITLNSSCDVQLNISDVLINEPFNFPTTYYRLYDQKGISFNTIDSDIFEKVIKYEVHDSCAENYCWGNLVFKRDSQVQIVICDCSLDLDQNKNLKTNKCFSNCINIKNADIPRVVYLCDTISIDEIAEKSIKDSLISCDTTQRTTTWLMKKTGKKLCEQVEYILSIPIEKISWPREFSTLDCVLSAFNNLPTTIEKLIDVASAFPYYYDPISYSTYRFKEFNSNICNVSIKYSDEQLLGSCSKTNTVFRKWTAVELCNLKTTTFLQKIQYIDTTGPLIIKNFEDTVINAVNNISLDCDLTSRLPRILFTYDNCNYTNNKINYGLIGKGYYDQQNKIFRGLQMGYNQAYISATDFCGNSAFDTIQINVSHSGSPILTNSKMIKVKPSDQKDNYKIKAKLLAKAIQCEDYMVEIMALRQDQTSNGVISIQGKDKVINGFPIFHYVEGHCLPPSGYLIDTIKDKYNQVIKLNKVYYFQPQQDVTICCTDIKDSINISVYALDSYNNLSTIQSTILLEKHQPLKDCDTTKIFIDEIPKYLADQQSNATTTCNHNIPQLVAHQNIIDDCDYGRLVEKWWTDLNQNSLIDSAELSICQREVIPDSNKNTIIIQWPLHRNGEKFYDIDCKEHSNIIDFRITNFDSSKPNNNIRFTEYLSNINPNFDTCNIKCFMPSALINYDIPIDTPRLINQSTHSIDYFYCDTKYETKKGKTIIREWNVVDWCNKNISLDINNNHVQTPYLVYDKGKDKWCFQTIIKTDSLSKKNKQGYYQFKQIIQIDTTLNQPMLKGTVENIQNIPIEDVEISLTYNDSVIDVTNTNNQGRYQIQTKQNKNSNLLPKANKAYENISGIDLQDVIQIQKHLLGIQDLTSPASILAADVNQNGIIDIGDINLIRKWILGIDTPKSGQMKLKFIRKDLDNLYNQNYKPYNSYIELNEKDTVLDIIAYKLGDVNGTATFGYQAEFRSSYKNNQTRVAQNNNQEYYIQSDANLELLKASQNSPNPFKYNTTINFYLDRDTEMGLEIYDILGNKYIDIKRIYKQGDHNFLFQPTKNDQSSSIYLCRISTAKGSKIIKMVRL